MAAANTVHVSIEASADGKALDEFAKSQHEVSKAIKGTETAAKSVEAPIEKAGTAGKKAAGKRGGRGGGGEGMLQLAQTLDDVQYGARGVMNNIPGLAMAFGVPTAAASALSIAVLAVVTAVEQLKKITAEGESEKFLGALTPDEESLARMDRFTAALKAQADEYERLRNSRKLAAEDAKAEAEFEAEKARLNMAGTPEDQTGGIAVIRDFEAGGKQRQAALNAGRDNVGASVGRVNSLDSQYAAQKKIVDDTERRDLLLRQLNAAKAITAERAAHDAAMDAQRYNTSGMALAVPESKYTKGEAARAAADAARIQQEMKGLSMPAVSQPLTGDAEKDFEILRAALAAEKERLAVIKEQRLEAAQKARAEAEALALLERKLSREQELAAIKLQGDIAQGAGAAKALPVLGDAAAPMRADFSAQTQQLAQITQQLGMQRDAGMSALLGGLTEFVTASAAEQAAIRGTVGQIKQAVEALRNKGKGGQ